MNLPANVVETDKRLQRSANELMEVRWHWTLDETNPDRVSQLEYARQVGVDHKRIYVDANAWADWLAAQGGARTARFIEIEGDLSAITQRLRKVLVVAENVGPTDEERELLVDSVGRVRALLNLVGLRIAGETDVDWDAELDKLTS